MAFPDDALTEDEEIVLHLHPHWKAAVGPVLVLLASLAATVIVWVVLPANDGGHIGVAVVGSISLFIAVTRGVWPLVVWRSDHYVFTDERVLLQDGVFTRERRDLPLSRINDHVMSQSLPDRILGCGTLRIDSIGDQAAVLESVPRIREVQTTLFELIETDRELHPDDEEEDEEIEPELPKRRWR